MIREAFLIGHQVFQTLISSGTRDTKGLKLVLRETCCSCEQVPWISYGYDMCLCCILYITNVANPIFNQIHHRKNKARFLIPLLHFIKQHEYRQFKQQYLIDKYHILEMSLPKTCVFALLVFASFAIVDRTYYIYLGLDISASHQQISSAYQQKKAKLEASQDSETKTNKLKLLQQAYSTLGTPEKRALYDRLNKDLFKKDKIVSDAKRMTDKNNRKGKTVQITLPVSVQDVYHGKTLEATFLKQTACEKCKGTGAESPKFLSVCNRCGGNGFSVAQGANYYGQRFVNQNTCPVCQGWGKQVTKACPLCNGKKVTTKQQKIKIKIPKGLPDGNIIKVINAGDEQIVGAPADFEVTIVQIPTDHWSRQGQNLIHTVQLSLKEAIFGFSKSIKHLSDQQIPVSRSGVTTRQTIMTIPNKGIENAKTGKQGKLTIKFRIIMPKFTDEQLDMWEQFFKNHQL